MINAFRFDAFKIRKSFTVKISLLVCFLCAFINPVLSAIRGLSGFTVLHVMATTFGTQEFVVILFAAAFLSRDYYSGFIHNVYPKQNKTAYVVSKICWITAFCVLYSALEFGTYCLTFLISSEKVVLYEKIVQINGDVEYFYTAWDYVRYLLLRVMEMFVIGNFMLLFTVLVKNAPVVAIGSLVYLMISVPVFRLINGIIGLGNFDLADYTATGIMSKARFSSPENYIWQTLIVLSIYLVVSIVLSVIVYRKRQF